MNLLFFLLSCVETERLPPEPVQARPVETSASTSDVDDSNNTPLPEMASSDANAADSDTPLPESLSAESELAQLWPIVDDLCDPVHDVASKAVTCAGQPSWWLENGHRSPPEFVQMVEGSFTAVGASEVALRRRPSLDLSWDLGGWVVVSVVDDHSHVVALDDYRSMPGYGNLESHVLHRQHAPDVFAYLWNYGKYGLNRFILNISGTQQEHWGLEDLGFVPLHPQATDDAYWPVYSNMIRSCDHFIDPPQGVVVEGVFVDEEYPQQVHARIFRIEKIETNDLEDSKVLRLQIVYGVFVLTVHNYIDACAQWDDEPYFGPLSDEVIALLGLKRIQLDVMESSETIGALRATPDAEQKWREVLSVVGDGWK